MLLTVRNGPGDQRAPAMERTERSMSGLYCTAASSVQPGITLVEPSSSTSEKRCVSGSPSALPSARGVTRCGRNR